MNVRDFIRRFRRRHWLGVIVICLLWVDIFRGIRSMTWQSRDFAIILVFLPPVAGSRHVRVLSLLRRSPRDIEASTIASLPLLSSRLSVLFYIYSIESNVKDGIK